MDIEKLIERLRKHRIIYKTNYDEFSGGACTADCVDAAEIISTLQAENERLQAELERMKKIMREDGIMVIPSKYPGGPAEWNIPKPRGQKEE